MTGTHTNQEMNNNTPTDTDIENKRYDQLTRFTYSAKLLLDVAWKALLNPSLRKPFFYGQIFPQIPHVYANAPYGHLEFNEEIAKKLQKAAATKPHGMATLWYGPFVVLYVTSNKARHASVKEELVGVVDSSSRQFIEWLSGGNKVMTTFPGYQSINSEPYREQRRFLHSRFHGGALKHLSRIATDTNKFLQAYAHEHGQISRPLKEILTALVLHTSSYLLGLTDYPLDKIYLDNPEFQKPINEVALYGVVKRYDPKMENILREIFIEIVKRNFDQIASDTKDNNLIRNIFSSLGMEFPDKFEQFLEISSADLHNIAMNFAATGLGGMVHSTTNTLDWALATLLKKRNKLNELSDLMSKNKEIDLSNPNVFDKSGKLFPICEWVLQTVYNYPPFSHELFYNQESFLAQIDNELFLEIPANSFTIVNHIACNESNNNEPGIWKKTFADNLAEKSTVGSFIMNKYVASFGGSVLERKNKISTPEGDVTIKPNTKTRICPGAMTSLYEQMIIIALLMRDYSLRVGNTSAMSLDPERTFPLCVRKSSGEICLTSKNSKKYAQLMQLNGIFKGMKKEVNQLTMVKPTNIRRNSRC